MYGRCSSGLTPMALISSSRMSLIFGLKTSTMMRIRSADLVVERIRFPSPRPLLAPLMIPGMSRIWILAPLWLSIPGITVSVVKS